MKEQIEETEEDSCYLFVNKERPASADRGIEIQTCFRKTAEELFGCKIPKHVIDRRFSAKTIVSR